jgi:hypothetical protein
LHTASPPSNIEIESTSSLEHRPGVLAMQIGSVLSRQSGTTTSGKWPEPKSVLSAAGRAVDALRSRSGGLPGTNPAVGLIMSQYDVTHITPQKYSEMVQRLHSSGALADSEFRDLAQVRMDLDAAGADPEEPVNLVDLYTQKVNAAQAQLQARAKDAGTAEQASLRQNMAGLQRRLDWLQKLSTIHGAPDSLGLDAVV